MVHVRIVNDVVTGVFAQPQPGLDGYQEIADDDPRLAAFYSPPPTQRDYVLAVQRVLDTKAQERAYDGILSACSYAASTNQQFAAEGQACVAWRDDVWAKCYGDLAKVQAGEMAQPTIEDFLASLPTLVWPDQT